MLGTAVPSELTPAAPHCRCPTAHGARVLDEGGRSMAVHDEGGRGGGCLSGERGKNGGFGVGGQGGHGFIRSANTSG